MPKPSRWEMTEFLSRINEILWRYWDPIGVYKDPMPSDFDEYSSYAGVILKLLYEYEIRRDRLEDYLMDSIRGHMSLTGPDEFYFEKNRETLDRIYTAWDEFKKEHYL
ncbi:MAG: hypothetical protein Q4C70_03405 [Planctomycetia bacterium]|nr:hypothetical protein [Planctomycetia bacterium]